MEVFAEVLQDFPYYGRHNRPGEFIPMPVEAARFWHDQGFVRLEARTVRDGSRTIRQDVFLGNVRHVVLDESGRTRSAVALAR